MICGVEYDNYYSAFTEHLRSYFLINLVSRIPKKG